jgi:hypothetical protein
VQYNIEDLIKLDRILYMGPRYQNSVQLHESYANKVIDTNYQMTAPSMTAGDS